MPRKHPVKVTDAGKVPCLTKATPPIRLIIEVQKGKIAAIYASDPSKVNVSLLDWDEANRDIMQYKAATDLTIEIENMSQVNF